MVQYYLQNVLYKASTTSLVSCAGPSLAFVFLKDEHKKTTWGYSRMSTVHYVQSMVDDTGQNYTQQMSKPGTPCDNIINYRSSNQCF